MPDNGPYIGKPGEGWDDAKELRWAAEREAGRIAFARAIQLVVAASFPPRRSQLFDRYGKQYGEHALGTLKNVVNHRLAQAPT